jgi:hypothetical protein
MPWKENSVMDQRLRCRPSLGRRTDDPVAAGTSAFPAKLDRRSLTGNKKHGLGALCDQSRRPVRLANQFSTHAKWSIFSGFSRVNMGRTYQLAPSPTLPPAPGAHPSRAGTRNTRECDGAPVLWRRGRANSQRSKIDGSDPPCCCRQRVSANGFCARLWLQLDGLAGAN